ncbi:MAG: hypothetical protein SFU98_16110 [Leptospiraceae bacterium]|nr:hypothetical protein [Leptospiraceae bacterium]
MNHKKNWKLESMPTTCFKESLLALTKEHGDKNSTNYTYKIKMNRRILCSAYLEGSECIGKGNSGKESKSWDYLLALVKDSNRTKQDYEQKFYEDGYVIIFPQETLIALVEIHGANKGSEVAKKALWLKDEVIDPYLKKFRYEIFWIQTGNGYPSRSAEFELKQIEIRLGRKKINRCKELDLDKFFKEKQ